MSRRWLAAAVVGVALVIAALFGWRAWRGRDMNGDTGAGAVVQGVQSDPNGGTETVETVNPDAAAIVTVGTTPMAQRVAVLGLLNKRNGQARELTLKPGQAIRVGDVAVHLRACERTASWEPDQLTGAFVQVDIRGVDKVWRRPFSGWLYKERPYLNVVQHPVYDVWTKSCAMVFPATGSATESIVGPAQASVKAPVSSAKKSPAAPSAAPFVTGSTDVATTPDRAVANSAR